MIKRSQQRFSNLLLHHAHIVQIAGESYWVKDKRKAGSIKASTKTQQEVSGSVKFTAAFYEPGWFKI